jgi:hypothetical protein
MIIMEDPFESLEAIESSALDLVNDENADSDIRDLASLVHMLAVLLRQSGVYNKRTTS